jgi:hypothetical protein
MLVSACVLGLGGLFVLTIPKASAAQIESIFNANQRIFLAPIVTLVDFKTGDSRRFGNVEFTVPADAEILQAVDCTLSKDERLKLLIDRQRALMAEAAKKGRALSLFGPLPVDYCELQ